MTQQQQPEQLARALISQLQGSPRDLESRATQSRLTFKAMIAAIRNNCDCEPCQLLRQALEALLAEPQEGIPPVSKPALPEAIEG